LVADSISPKGVELLRSTPDFDVTVKTGMSPEELAQTLPEFDALIVRSATKVTEEVLRSPGRLRAIGRAGTGVDNIHLEAATRAGVVVMNTPGGNSLAAAELTLAHLLAMARNVPQANADLRDGRWERKRYMGVELAGKVLGIVGLGRIGREVAKRARAFRMDVIGYDPYVTAEAAENAGVRYMALDELVPQADFISLHVPLTPETKHLFDAERIGKMKPDARIINCARGGLIDEAALVQALEAGGIAGAALDVFENEPPTDKQLLNNDKIISTPHLGASTSEAQERVATEIAEKIRDYIQSGVILDAVNFPSIDREAYEELGPAMDLAERLGTFLAQIVEGGFKRFEVRTFGYMKDYSLKPIVMAATKGLLTPLVEGGVSYVNSLALANERGITVEDGRSSEPTPFKGLLRLILETDQGKTTVAGTFFGANRPRLVEVDGVTLESRPSGHLLVFRNRDVPGVVGKIGSILGQADVNIAGIQLGRFQDGESAVSIITVDGPVPADALDQIRSIDEIVLARAVAG
jgi:D-3-phosphoglycerate dehydrogenase